MGHERRRKPLPGLLAALAAGCAAAPPPGPYVWRPVGTAAGTVSVSRPGVDLEIEPLTAPERALWLRRTQGLDEDPLATRGGRYLTLRVRLRATGDQPVHLETQSAMLWAEGAPPAKPLDYTRAFELLEGPDAEPPDSDDVARLMRGLLDGPVEVAPGEVREGLLVFPEPRAAGETLVLEFPFLQVGPASHRVRVALGKIRLPERPVPGNR
ncbi:MAG: hypothetical protein D6718_00770 [Acidobacteria bacterium]|nr:MAG: hypothetical protein D6718_00770 [Acidobacteriota bacterium]